MRYRGAHEYGNLPQDRRLIDRFYWGGLALCLLMTLEAMTWS